MKIRVQFFSHLKDAVGVSEQALDDLPEGMTAGDLLSQLYDKHAALRPWDSSILIGAGVEFVDRDYVIRTGDEIAIMPPVQGG